MHHSVIMIVVNFPLKNFMPFLNAVGKSKADIQKDILSLSDF